MKRLFSLALISLGVLLMIGATGYWSYNQKLQYPALAPLPERVADLSLTQSLATEEAIAEFTRLHGNDFPLTSAAVGMYGDDHSVTLWVAGVPFEPQANRMLVAMRDKITSTSGRSLFTPLGELQDGSRTVYKLDGIGQKHFYFQSGKLIVWLATEPKRAEEVLSQILSFYP